MPESSNTLLTAALASDSGDPRPWDLFGSCDRYYWNRSGRTQRQHLRARLAATPRAALAVSVQAERFSSARRVLEDLAGCAPIEVLGWTARCDECYVLLCVADPLPASTSNAILAVPGVLHVEPDRERTAALYRLPLPDATLFDPLCERIVPIPAQPMRVQDLEAQAAIKAMGLPRVDGSSACAPQVVAIIDNGVEWDHPYIAAQLWHNEAELREANCADDDHNGYVNDCIGWNFYDNSPDPRPYGWRPHGTQVAGLVAAVTNSAGAAVRIMPIRTDGPGSRLSLAGLARAIDYASRNGARTIVIAQSWSLKDIDPQAPDLATFRESVRAAGERGSLLVCAAGNLKEDIAVDAREPATSGLTLDNVLTVQGTGPGFQRSNLASRHADQLVVAAGGIDLRSISTQGRMAQLFYQTSAAAAIVAGVSAVLTLHRKLTDARSVKRCLLRCRDPSAHDPADLQARLLDLRYLG